MKILHIPFCFYPDSMGGTEIYVMILAKELQKNDVEVLICAPGKKNEKYEYNGIRIRRFKMEGNVEDLEILYGKGDNLAANEFRKILEEENPDVVHLHAFTHACSVRLVREAKRYGIPVVFTYHTPTVSCQRGTLMYWGSRVCEGKLKTYVCARCTLHGLGLGRLQSIILGSLPPFMTRWIGKTGLKGKAWTAFRMTELIAIRHVYIKKLFSEVDQIVVLNRWSKEVLIKNGVLASKITISSHGLVRNSEENFEIKNQDKILNEKFLKVIFLGRLDETKGVDILIKALHLIPQSPIQLDIYGIIQGSSDERYMKELKSLSGSDKRISFCSPVPNDLITSILSNYHLLAVPSRWLETGPLVVLEAFAAGIPVMGSNLGGISELIQQDVNGLLVKVGSVEAWRDGFLKLSENRDLISKLTKGVRPPRNIQKVEDEMVKLYQQVLKN